MTGQELQRLLEDHQMYHSDLQIDRFITAKEGGTPYGCYKQALRELSKRYRALKSLLIDRALLTVDIDELEELVKVRQQNKFGHCRRHLELAQKKMKMDDLERTLKDTCREFARFYGQAESLKEKIGDLTPEKRATLDEEMWTHHLKAQMAVDLLARGHIAEGTIEAAQVMPAEFREEMRQAFDIKNGERFKQHEIVEWYLSLKPVVFDGKELMPPEEVMKFLQEGS